LQQQLGDIPQFDPSGLQEQIGGLEDRLANIPQFDPSGLQDRLKALEGKETPTFDPSQLQQGIAGLEDRLANIPQFDPSALQNRLSELENRQAPTFNPEDFREQFLNIAREGIDIPPPTQAFDPSGLQDRLQALESREMPQFDPSKLQERLSALENVQPVAAPPAFDPSGLQARLDALENRAPAPAPPAFDPSGLQARLDALEGREPVVAPPAFDPSSLQERLAALENRQPVASAFDPSSLQARLDALESREPVAAPPAFDPSGLMARLDDFESRLGALQQPLPIQPPANTNLPTPSAPLEGEAIARPVMDPSLGLPPSSSVGADFAARERAGILPNQQPVPTPVSDLPTGPMISAQKDGPGAPTALIDAALANQKAGTLPNQQLTPTPVSGLPTGPNANMIAPRGDGKVFAGGTPGFDFTGGNPLATAPGYSLSPGSGSVGGTIRQEPPDTAIGKPVGPGIPFDPVAKLPGPVPTPEPAPIAAPKPPPFISIGGPGAGPVTPPSSRPQPPVNIGGPALPPQPPQNVVGRPVPPISIGRPVQGGPIPQIEGGTVITTPGGDPFNITLKRGEPEPPSGNSNVLPGQSRLYSNELPREPVIPISGPGGDRPTPPVAGTGTNFRPTPPVAGTGTNFRPTPPMSIGGPGGRRDDLVFPGGSPTFNERGETLTTLGPESMRGEPSLVGQPADLDLGIKQGRPSLQDFAKPLPNGGTIFDQLEDLGKPNKDDMVFAGGSPTFDETGGDVLAGAPEFSNTGVGSAPVQTGEVGAMAGSPATGTPGETTNQATNQATTASGEQPFAAGVTQVATGLDPLTEQLLFGIGGQGGFIPGAMRAAEKVFYDDQGNPVVIDEQVAEFSPDQIAAIELQRKSLGMQDPFIEDAKSALESSMEAYDPSITGQFFNPFEDQVVQQTIEDVMERGAKSDIGALAGNIARGGQSAFGSRARLGASERQEALGRGLAEALSGIRSRGFTEAQRTGLGEFARLKDAERLGAAGIAGLGGQAAGARSMDISNLLGLGGLQQDQLQRLLDAEQRNLLQRQMTPLLQYQALAPFIGMAPAGQFTTTTQFAPPPSPMQAGLGVGLSSFGALGQLFGGGK